MLDFPAIFLDSFAQIVVLISGGLTAYGTRIVDQLPRRYRGGSDVAGGGRGSCFPRYFCRRSLLLRSGSKFHDAVGSRKNDRGSHNSRGWLTRSEEHTSELQSLR